MKNGKIRNYIQLVKPSFWQFFFQLVTAMLANVTIPIAAIFAAKAIVAITTADYKMTVIYLAIELAIHILRQVFWEMNYRGWYWMFKRDYTKVQYRIYDRVMSGSSDSVAKIGKNSILNIAGNDVGTVCTFSDTIATKLSKIIQLVLTLSIVFASNFWIGISVLLLGAVDLAILLVTNRKIANETRRAKESIDHMYANVDSMVEHKSLISDINAKDYFNDFKKRVDGYLDAIKKTKMLNLFKGHWFYAIYKVIIFFMTCFLVQLLSGASISLETYILVTPYLLTCTELINDMINMTYDIEDLDVSTKRINTILSMSDEDLSAYGKITDYSSAEDLSFVNVSYSCSDPTSAYYGKVSNADLSFKFNELNIVKGAKKSGKRVLFYLLSRKIKPSEGKIIIDGIDIFGYNRKSYQAQITTMAYKPQFLNESIGTNLRLITKNKAKINSALRQVGLYEKVRALPNRLETNISDAGFDEFEQFLLSLARAILIDSHILAIYEYPNTLSTSELLHVKDVLKGLSGKKTIVLFTAKHDFDDISKLTYVVENGRVSYKI